MTKITAGTSSFECGDIHDTDESPAHEDQPHPARNLDYNSKDVLTGEELCPKPMLETADNFQKEGVSSIGATGNSMIAL